MDNQQNTICSILGPSKTLCGFDFQRAPEIGLEEVRRPLKLQAGHRLGTDLFEPKLIQSFWVLFCRNLQNFLGKPWETAEKGCQPGHSARTLQLRLPLVGGEVSALRIFHTSGPGRWKGWQGQGEEVGVEAGHPLLGRRNSYWLWIAMFFAFFFLILQLDQHGMNAFSHIDNRMMIQIDIN